MYSDCGTACPRTCDDPNPEFCTLQCVEGILLAYSTSKPHK